MKVLKLSILLILLFLPGSTSCTSSIDKSSVVKFDCRDNMHGQVIPGTPNIKLLVSSCDDYIFKEQQMLNALEIFVKIYAENFSITELEVWKKISSLSIEVSALPKTVSSAFDIKGNLINNVPVSGLAISKDLIWVEIRTKNIWSSSLVHELVHIIIWRNQIHHGDPDHEGKEYSGWSQKHSQLIKEVNNRLLDLDI